MTLIKNKNEWEIYRKKYASHQQKGGEPIRYPVVVSTCVYNDRNGYSYAAYSFGYEEILIAMKKAMREQKNQGEKANV